MPAKGTWIEQVNNRTRNGKKRVDSADPRHFAVDVTIGSVHYQEDGEWKEIDNIFEPAVAPWDWQMLKAGYHIRVKEDFTAGQIIEFEKQGETVQFQPMALEWTNDLDQIQPISMPHEVTPTITNPEVDLLPAVGMPSHQGTIKWSDGYGEGIDFEWRCTSTRLVKILEIENLNKLPIPEQYILDGGNPVLRLNLIFDPSSGVDIYVDGELWDKKERKQTFDVVEFRKDGEVLWGFMPLRYWGSYAGDDEALQEANEGQSVATLEKRGNKLYISIRVPYEWLQDAIYPVFIDTDVDEKVGAGDDDAYEKGDGAFDRTGDYVFVKSYSDTGSSNYRCGGVRFQTVNVPQGSTIDVAYPQVYKGASTYDDPNLKIYAEDVDDAVDFLSNANVISRTRTDAYASWVAVGIGTGWLGSGIDIKTVIKEIVDRGNWVANNDLVLLYIANIDITKTFRFASYEFIPAGTLCAILHIEYSVGGPTPGWNKIAYTSEPPTPNAWNQVKQDAGTGWIKILYEGE